eukprot:14384075-Alexandrium_andersonii.AAC.1
MADCQSAGTVCERQQGELPSRGRWAGRSSTTALVGPGEAPRTARPVAGGVFWPSSGQERCPALHDPWLEASSGLRRARGCRWARIFPSAEHGRN